jgi:hypothetical protein
MRRALHCPTARCGGHSYPVPCNRTARVISVLRGWRPGDRQAMAARGITMRETWVDMPALVLGEMAGRG